MNIVLLIGCICVMTVLEISMLVIITITTPFTTEVLFTLVGLL